MKKAQALWHDYTKYKERMCEVTNVNETSYTIMKANKKTTARLEAISHLLKSIPYK